jgi:SAM-dependent methyltransferase
MVTRFMIHFWHDNSTEAVLNRLGKDLTIIPTTRVLNIACEHNLVPEFLRGRIDEKNVFGVELDDHVIDGKRIKRCDVDHEPLPFEDKSIDLVVSVWGLEHFKTDNIFKEVRRVLRPGGQFIFVTPNRNHPIFMIKQVMGSRFAQWYFRRILRTDYEPHKTFYHLNSYRNVRDAAVSADLDLQQFVFLGPANLKYYFNFSRALQKALSAFEHLITNRVLGRFKPYIVGVLQA